MTIVINEIIENKERLNSYLSKITINGILRAYTHRKFLFEDDPSALLYAYIMEKYDLTFKEVKELLKRNQNEIHTTCVACGAELKNRLNRFCSKKCLAGSEETKTKRKNTYLRKYGTTGLRRSEATKEKIRQTCIKKYGVENPFQAKEIKEKIKRTCIERYGTDCARRSPEIQSKIVTTCIERYGAKNPVMSEEVKSKIRNSCIKKYGKGWVTGSPTFVKKCRKTFKINKYDFFIRLLKVNNLELLSSYDEYLLSDKLKFRCTSCGEEFEAKCHISDQYLIRCKKCKKKDRTKSGTETEIVDFLRSLGIEYIIRNDKKLIHPYELDIYLPNENIAIEFDGLYWHSDKFRGKMYHLNKTLKCANKGISLIHILESEWMYKKDIVKSIIKARLGIFDKSITAKDCVCKKLTLSEYKTFLTENHVQGYHPAKIRIGLFNGTDLISCVGIGKSNNGKDLEIIRFCNARNVNIPDGLSFILNWLNATNISMYIDRRYFIANSYINIGFVESGTTMPSAIYTNGEKTLYPQHDTYHNLTKVFNKKYDKKLSEDENLALLKFRKVYDCGTIKLKFNGDKV